MAGHSEQEKLAFFATLSPTHPDTELKAGDVVTFTNENGVVFRDRVIAGFDLRKDGNWLPGRVAHLDKDAWWFPVKLSELELQEPPKPIPEHIGNWS